MLAPGPRAIEWLLSGALVTLFGVLIKYVGWTWLLAGYSESTSSVPDDVVRDVAGSTVLRIGVAVFAFGVVVAVTDPPVYLDLVFVIAIVLAVGRLLYRLNTWSPSETD